jgi:aryl-alcohol dehydrogenase-like predicted oxidoreductase
MDRREFLAGAAAVPAVFAAERAIPRREYKPGIELSVIGFGGIVVVGQEQPAANRTVAEAFDRGINYFDVAPSYWDGEAEIKLGEALKPYRNRAFLACKTTERSADGARRELERSLQRLNTDHFDLYQFHAVTSMADVEQILKPGGAGELFRKAREDGKIRFLGCSAHHPDAAIKLMDSFPLDSILFPVNFNAWGQGHFGPQILAHAKAKGVTRLALKALALGKWPDSADKKKYPKCWYQPVDEPELADRALRFTLSQEITAAIPPGDERLFGMALDIASRFTPLSTKEQEALLAQPQSLEPVFKV